MNKENQDDVSRRAADFFKVPENEKPFKLGGLVIPMDGTGEVPMQNMVLGPKMAKEFEDSLKECFPKNND